MRKELKSMILEVPEENRSSIVRELVQVTASNNPEIDIIHIYDAEDGFYRESYNTRKREYFLHFEKDGRGTRAE